MQVGDLVRSKWLAYNQLGLITGNATPDEGWALWCVEWVGENDVHYKYTIEDERDLEVVCK